MLLYRLVKSYANLAATRGITKQRRREIRNDILNELALTLRPPTLKNTEPAMQDLTFPSEVKNAEKILAILAPNTNGISGGVFSLFSIAAQLRRIQRAHGYEVIILTLPSKSDETYFRNTFFRNEENVYRLSQLNLCHKAKEIYLHIPEYAVIPFISDLSDVTKDYLKQRDKVFINIANQNVTLMPSKEAFAPLYEFSDSVSQSVAHHAYFNQETADKFGIPTLFLPAYTDLSAYPPSRFPEKEKLIIYSPDQASYKQKTLDAISKNMPDFELMEIRGITFDKYMELATRCMFSITFGEGFDGYLAQPIHQGGIGIAAYNEDFFPSPDFLRYPNIFKSGDSMADGACNVMLQLSLDETAYSKLNYDFLQEYKKLYSFEEYVAQIRKLSLRQFEYFPDGATEPPKQPLPHGQK